MKTHFLVIILALIFFAIPADAKDYGKRGHDNAIAEEDIGSALMKKIQNKVQSPDFKKKHEAAVQRAFKKAGTFKPIAGISEALEYHSHYYNPVHTVEEDIRLPSGKLLAKKGQKIDPTKSVGDPDFGFLFFDGDNPQHIAWAKQQNDSYKWILVKGAPFDLAAQEDRWVGFDQGGNLSNKFQIKHVPCRVSPEGKCLHVEELPIE